MSTAFHRPPRYSTVRVCSHLPSLSSPAPRQSWNDAFVQCASSLLLLITRADPLNRWYLRRCTAEQRGSPHGPYAALVAALEKEIAICRPSRIVTIGASAGGYAAIRAGLALHASAVLAFSPQVFLEPAQRSALELPPMFFDEQLRALHADAQQSAILTEPAHACWARRGCPPRRHARREVTTTQTYKDRATRPFAVSTQAVVSNVKPSASPTAIEVHVGGDASGDVQEAALLREAINSAVAGASPLPNATPGRHTSYTVPLPAPVTIPLSGAGPTIPVPGSDSILRLPTHLPTALPVARSPSSTISESGNSPWHLPAVPDAATHTSVAVHVHAGLGHTLATDMRDAGHLENLLLRLMGSRQLSQ